MSADPFAQLLDHLARRGRSARPWRGRYALAAALVLLAAAAVVVLAGGA